MSVNNITYIRSQDIKLQNSIIFQILMSFHVNLMKAISDELRRPISDFNPFLQALEQNWYTTEEAIRSMPDEEFYRLGFPGQLVQKIRQKIGYPQNKQQQQQPAQQPQQQPQQQQYAQHKQYGQQQKQPQSQYQQGNQYGQKQPAQQYPQQQYQQSQQQQKSKIELLLVQARKRLGEEEFLACVEILLKIFFNIQNNIGDERYRTVKKGNTLGRIYKHQQFVEVLKEGGFEDQGPAIVMKKFDLSYLNAVTKQIQLNTQPKFDPYKATITSLSTSNQLDMHESSQYPQLLEKLKKQRERLMSTPIKNRDIKIYKFKSEQHMAENAQVFSLYNQDNPTEDEKIFVQQLKENLKRLEVGQNFMSKRKAEYVDLLKKPCFSECIARVKCPNNTIFECKFSPMQKLGLLVQFFRQNLINKNMPFYIYMTPPVRRIEGALAQKTFFEQDCIPRATFYFGSDLNIGNAEIFSQPKAGFFHV